jgi:hypothetical protein
MFRDGGNMARDERGDCPSGTDPLTWDSAAMNRDHPFCGAQTTVQRWWADPLLNRPLAAGGKDRTLLTVFTHDHFGPSSHQHHGLYAALVVEPAGSIWQTLDGRDLGTGPSPRADGGPTSYAANIITPKQGIACELATDPSCVDHERTSREFALAFADYALVYTDGKGTGLHPVNPTNRVDGNLPSPVLHTGTPAPEGISTKDPGSQLLNYRNEPIPLRISEEVVHGPGETARNPLSCTDLADGQRACRQQRLGEAGDIANVFSSKKHESQGASGQAIFTEKLGQARQPGDPATPLLMAYAGDHVQIRLVQGAQEENHIFNMHGVKWLSQPDSPNSGYMNAQPIGISEHFEFRVSIDPVSPQRDADYLFSASATDNLWDGQWGLLRAYEWKSQKAFLARLPTYPTEPDAAYPAAGISCPKEGPRRHVEVSAVLASKWLESVPGANDGALIYNVASGLNDPQAILFVRKKETEQSEANSPKRPVCDAANGNAALQCTNRKRPEPLILRAAAGECLFVKLHNELPSEMPDTWRDVAHPDIDTYRRSWSYNTMPPTTPGFNFNQFTSSSRVSLHPQLVAVNGLSEDGSFVGFNEDSTVGPGETREYHWYAGDFSLKPKQLADGSLVVDQSQAPIEFGAIALRDMADVIKHSSHGAVGALVIEPKGASWRTDLEASRNDHSVASATVDYTDGKGAKRRFRDFVVVYQDDVSLRQRDTALPNLRNADDAEDTGHKAFNYRTEPQWARLRAAPSAEPGMMNDYDYADAFSSRASRGACVADPAHGKFCDPETPLFEANAGDPIRLRVVDPAGHPRNHGFTVSGHDWLINPWVCNSESTVMGWNQFSENRVGSSSAIGPARHLNIVTTAGGDFHVPGDYLYRTQEGFMFSAGLWGLLRVHPEAGGWHNAAPRTFCKDGH